MIVIVSDGELNLWINFHKAMSMKLGDMDEGKESGPQLTERSGASLRSSDRSGLQELFGYIQHYMMQERAFVLTTTRPFSIARCTPTHCTLSHRGAQFTSFGFIS